MRSATSFFYQNKPDNLLSRKSYYLLLTTVALTYFLKLNNSSAVIMTIASIFIGEYFNLPTHSNPVERSNNRSLGFVESALDVQHKRVEGASNVGAIMSVNGVIDSHKIQETLILLMKRHPLLCAKIMNSGSTPSLEIQRNVSIHSLPFKLEKRTSERFAREYLENILDEPFFSGNHQNSGVLWELTLVKNDNPNGPHDLILKAHHAIFDGTSVGIFMQELLSFYNGEKTVAHPLPFLKPAENIVTNQTNWTRFLLNHIYLQIWEALFGERMTYRKHVCTERLFSRRKTKVLFCQLDENNFELLLEACKKFNITLTSLMTFALLQATREVLGELSIETISTPVSVRPYFSNNVSSEDHIGCNVANTIIKLPITKEMTIVQIAQHYKKELSKCIPVIYPANFDPRVWKLKIMEHDMLSDKTHFNQGISVSNLGKTHFISFQRPGAKLKLLRLNFCASRRLGDKAMQLFAMTAGGKLNMCFAYADPLLQHYQAERIQQKTLDLLKNLIGHNNESKLMYR